MKSTSRVNVLRVLVCTLILSVFSAVVLPGLAFAADLPPGMLDTSQYKTDPPWRVGLAGLGETNAWMTMFRLHFKYGVNEKYSHLFEPLLTTSSFWKPTKQINDIESLLAKNVDLLFVPPASEAALVGAVEEAMARGVPVVLASTKVNTDEFVTWVSRDNQKAGFLYGQWMGKQLDGEGNVVSLMGTAGTSYAEDVYRGVQQGLSKHPDIKEIGMANVDWSPVKAKKAMEAFLQKDQEIDGIIADGGQIALGAVKALLDAGEPIPPITADDWNGWLRMAKKHDIDFLAVSGGNPLALDCVQLAVKILRGEPVPHIVEHPITTFTEEKLDQYYRPDLNDQYFAVNKLPESWIQENYAK